MWYFETRISDGTIAKPTPLVSNPEVEQEMCSLYTAFAVLKYLLWFKFFLGLNFFKPV